MLASTYGHAQTTASTNQFAIRDRYTVRTFPEIRSAVEWRKRAVEIKEQALVSCGLWPLPQKAPLDARVFGKIERDGYTVEKVYMQTWPGFYLAGNLYRPRDAGTGAFPAVLCPHGHWARGRLTDTDVASVPARCITFARMGFIAFSYDMVDCVDTRFADTPPNPKPYDFHKEFGTSPSDQLWNISLLGVQTWNSVRALDFLESLADVDKSRIVCNGASSGGTQTFMLGAVDDRLAAQSPVCMVSHTMQGGCVCENAPGLRIQFSNMEIAAAPAPRPQLLVGATGDWTRTTLAVEGPALREVYDLFGAGEKLAYTRFDAPHNYNLASRQAVYAWLGASILRRPDMAEFKEKAYAKDADSDLRVFTDGNLPDGALTKAQFVQSLKDMHRRNWESLLPSDNHTFETFKVKTEPLWRHTLSIPAVLPEQKTPAPPIGNAGHFKTELTGVSGAIPIVVFQPAGVSKGVVVLIHPDGRRAYLDGKIPLGLASSLLNRGCTVVLPELFLSGRRADPQLAARRNYFTNHFTTHNRTDLQERIVELAVVYKWARSWSTNRLILCGEGRAGLWALLAAPLADAVVADCGGLDVSSDDVMLERDLFCPGIRNVGGFEGAPMLAAPHPLILFNASASFPVDGIRAAYKSLAVEKAFFLRHDVLAVEDIVNIVTGKQ